MPGFPDVREIGIDAGSPRSHRPPPGPPVTTPARYQMPGQNSWERRHRARPTSRLATWSGARRSQPRSATARDDTPSAPLGRDPAAPHGQPGGAGPPGRRRRDRGFDPTPDGGPDPRPGGRPAPPAHDPPRRAIPGPRREGSRMLRECRAAGPRGRLGRLRRRGPQLPGVGAQPDPPIGPRLYRAAGLRPRPRRGEHPDVPGRPHRADGPSSWSTTTPRATSRPRRSSAGGAARCGAPT
jgi:hypothetical protein